MRVQNTSQARKRVHLRVRKKVIGTGARPRLAVYRSAKHIYAQAIDDGNGRTLAAASSREKDVSGVGNVKSSATIGKLVAERLREKGIESVVFDRGGFKYHGRVKALADAARKAGLTF